MSHGHDADYDAEYDAVVCGAGVAGLAAACALGRLGHRVLVLEKRPEPQQVAKGEVLQPGSLGILREWGVADRLEAAGALRLEHLVARAADGTPRMRLDYGHLPTPQPWLLAHDYPTILRALGDSLPRASRCGAGRWSRPGPDR